MANISLLRGLQGAPDATSEVHSTAQLQLGTFAVDGSNNIYVYVDFQESMVAGEVVVIDTNWAASQITNTSKGWVGVVIGTVSASDRYGWAQIYGVHTAALATSGVTSGGALIVSATTDTGHFDEGTTSAGVFVFGAWSLSAASTATTTVVPASISVQLNFPYVLGYSQEIMSS